ncbi:MAG: hypothetical protein JNM30_20185 [Rhodospirillales bacterium]|nr:hypothetical protein [Rhodospirillales bacterium]
MMLGTAGDARADAETEGRAKEPIYRPTRPADFADFLTRCREDSLYCEDQFTLYIQRYAAVKIPELADRPEYKKLREGLRDPEAFDGICLPREQLFSEKLPVDMARGLIQWGEQHKDALKDRPPPAIKRAMQTLYPCWQLN